MKAYFVLSTLFFVLYSILSDVHQISLAASKSKVPSTKH